jgi:hypothetical protein
MSIGNAYGLLGGRHGGLNMRAFIAACLALIVIGAGGYFGVNAMQQPSGSAYTTDGARIDPKWTSRADCGTRTAWEWFFVDFGKPSGESALCSVSQ